MLSLSLAGMQKYVTEGQHLELTAIAKEQSGSYECIASNDISSPDVRIVQVTVNCKRQNLNTQHTGWTGWTHLHNPFKVPEIKKIRPTQYVGTILWLKSLF